MRRGEFEDRTEPLRLGLGANWRQFTLLVAINAFVGGMVGLERAILPVLAETEFGVASRTAALSFIATFGLTKAVADLLAGRLSERFGRRRILVAGWLFGLPVPVMLILAPGWEWVVAANVLLGANQGLAWSMTVNMKIDLVGPARRGLALGLNEAAGYLSVAAVAYLTGVIAQAHGARPEPFYVGIGLAAVGTALSVLFVRDTRGHLAAEMEGVGTPGRPLPVRDAFIDASWRRRDLFGISQAGLVNNLNDAVAWGVFPLLFFSRGASIQRVAALAALYPLVWGSLQVGAGWLSDVVGRRAPVVVGMVLQGIAIAVVGAGDSLVPWGVGVALLGAGTALVYPTLLAAIGDAVRVEDRATTLGVYRFWRDLGTVIGALAAGALADAFGLVVGIEVVAAVTVASGVVAAVSWREASRPDRGRPSDAVT